MEVHCQTIVDCSQFQPLALTANIGYRYYAHNLHRFYNCDWPIKVVPQLRLGPAANSVKKIVCG